MTDTLGDAGNYKVVETNNERDEGFFRRRRTNALLLKPKDNGCELQIKMTFTGNDDEGALRSRVNRALAKMKAAKQSTPAKSAGNL